MSFLAGQKDYQNKTSKGFSSGTCSS